MKLCEKALKIKADREGAVQYNQQYINNHEPSPRTRAMESEVAGGKREVARALNKHLTRCKVCSP